MLDTLLLGFAAVCVFIATMFTLFVVTIMGGGILNNMGFEVDDWKFWQYLVYALPVGLVTGALCFGLLYVLGKGVTLLFGG